MVTCVLEIKFGAPHAMPRYSISTQVHDDDPMLVGRSSPFRCVIY